MIDREDIIRMARDYFKAGSSSHHLRSFGLCRCSVCAVQASKDMKHFLLADSPSSSFKALVFATSIERPHTYLSTLADEFKRRDLIGNVLFDLLVANGPKSQRYFVVNFDGSRFESFEPVQPEPEIKMASSRFYSDHLDQFDTSLLTPAMRFALRRGVC